MKYTHYNYMINKMVLQNFTSFLTLIYICTMKFISNSSLPPFLPLFLPSFPFFQEQMVI